MQTKRRILLPFIHQQSFLLLQDEISVTKSVSPTCFSLYSACWNYHGNSLYTHKSHTAQSSPKITVDSSNLQACLQTEHWFDITPTHTPLYKEKMKMKERIFKIFITTAASTMKCKAYHTSTEELIQQGWYWAAQSCFSLTWQDSNGSGSVLNKVPPK